MSDLTARIIQLVTGVVAIFFLGMVAGSAASYFHFFPWAQFNSAFMAIDAILLEQHQLSLEFNRGGTLRVDHDKAGVMLWNQDLALNGYTLVATAHGQTVNLLDMEGNVAHSWQLDYLDMWDDRDQVKQPVPERFIFVRKARMEANGDLLVIFSAWATTPNGYGIAKVDKDSNVLWKNFRHIHHSFDQVDGGKIYALDYEIMTEPPAYLPGWPVPNLGDGVSIYSPEGVFLERFSFMDSFFYSPFRLVLVKIARHNDSGGLGDYLHSNDVEILRADLAELFPMAEAGDLLVSFRELDGVAIIDAKSKTVKWFRRGYWRAQHDADFLPNGNMLVFDNIFLEQEFINGEQRSRVIEFDPQSMAMVWEYTANDDESFYSSARASQQRLSNGNTLITESNSGRIIEVTLAGDIVWEYYNPVRLGTNSGLIPGVFWATRYTAGDIDFSLSGT